ncbi:uncharacterized protein LOC129592949 isoform X2 [Paramacrobiotus metropolitanus]|uniref:uncharacterized protein LOC129592949 isoform X2 n=1 Tax=Paramacrobiotus metropolitanus TaxID=2943436 RepID=UPI002445ADBE|nr:uncharacterized protein LOC129592949 isoform X2 [Paramacrobiotus metropolitanus]
MDEVKSCTREIIFDAMNSEVDLSVERPSRPVMRRKKGLKSGYKCQHQFSVKDIAPPHAPPPEVTGQYHSHGFQDIDSNLHRDGPRSSPGRSPSKESSEIPQRAPLLHPPARTAISLAFDSGEGSSKIPAPSPREATPSDANTSSSDDDEDPDPNHIDYVTLCASIQPVIHQGFIYRRARKLDTAEHLAYICYHHQRRREICPGGLYVTRASPHLPFRTAHCHGPNFQRCLDLYLEEAALRHLHEWVFEADDPLEGYKAYYAIDCKMAELLPTWETFRKHCRAELKAAKKPKFVAVSPMKNCGSAGVGSHHYMHLHRTQYSRCFYHYESQQTSGGMNVAAPSSAVGHTVEL